MPSSIVGIHPADGDLRFLKRMIRLLDMRLGKDFKYLRLSNNYWSHAKCLTSIKAASLQDTIIFLCHGRSTGLLGCNFMAQFSTYPRRYEHGELISLKNIEVLKGRKVFCLACDSNSIAAPAIDAGARVFIGFNDIYFDRKDLMEADRLCRHVVDITKYTLRTCIFTSIIFAWEQNITYSQWVNYFKLLINKANDDLVMNHRNHYRSEYYLRAANNLQLIKEGVRLWGDGDIRLSE